MYLQINDYFNKFHYADKNNKQCFILYICIIFFRLLYLDYCHNYTIDYCLYYCEPFDYIEPVELIQSYLGLFCQLDFNNFQGKIVNRYPHKINSKSSKSKIKRRLVLEYNRNNS